MRWQNLAEDRCPSCGGYLHPAPGKYAILACLVEECAFRIREDSIARMSTDPAHPMNRFTKRTAT